MCVLESVFNQESVLLALLFKVIFLLNCFQLDMTYILGHWQKNLTKMKSSASAVEIDYFMCSCSFAFADLFYW